MITFHKLTLAQYQKVVAKGNAVVDGLYFITDKRVIKLHNGEGSVTTFGITIEFVDEFPDSGAQLYCIYEDRNTKEQRMWDGNQWQIISYPSYPVVNQITSGIALSTTTLPDTQAVYNFVNNKVAASELGIRARLHTPVYSLEQLANVPLSSIEDRCMILVQDVGLYRYDAQSIDNVDPQSDAVIKPNEIPDYEGGNPYDTAGRWIKMFNNVGFTYGDGIQFTNRDINQIISLNVASSQFEFVDGKLTIKQDLPLVDGKVDKISGHADQLATWRNDGNQNASGYRINTSDYVTNNGNFISPDPVINRFVHNITDKKLDDVTSGSDGKIIIGKGNEGKVDASTYEIGTDFDNLTDENIANIPEKKVATERAVKWYVDRCMTFNNEDVSETISGVIEPYQ